MSPRPAADYHDCPMWRVHVHEEDSDLWPAFHYAPKRRMLGINIPGFESFVVISHCPWCGGCLPKDLSDEWFEQLEALLGEEVHLIDDTVPPKYRTEEWWREQGL